MPWRALTWLPLLLVLAASAWAQLPRPFVHVFHRTQVGIASGADAHVLGYSLLTVHVAAAGTPSFNVHFLGSLDATNWTLHHCQATSLSAHVVGNVTPQAVAMHTALGTGIWRCNVTGFTHFRAHVTAFTGTTSVTVVGTALSTPFAPPAWP